MSTTTLLTVEQFEQLPEEDGVRYELKDGELVKMGLAKSGYEIAKSEILGCLFAYIAQQPVGRVFAQTAFALSPSRVCIPDVSFLRTELVAQAGRDHIFRCAPDLAIEVVSDSESASELLGKIQEYLDAGTKAVWAFYPNLRTIAVYGQTGMRQVRGEQVLEAPEILPGFQATANDFLD